MYPADCPHSYDDKFGLVEFLGNTTLASALNVLEFLGVTDETFGKLYEWSQNRSVTLAFEAEQRCTFDKKEKRVEKSATEYVSTTSFLGMSATSTSSSSHKIKEWFWTFRTSWQLYAYQGTNVEGKVVIASHAGSTQLVTRSKHTPHSDRSFSPVQVNITWLLQQTNSQRELRFAIDRSRASCHTPRRNEPVTSALSFVNGLSIWAASVQSHFEGSVFPIQPQGSANFPLSQIEVSSLFVPVVPLFDESLLHKDSSASDSSSSSAAATSSSSAVTAVEPPADSVVLRLADINRFLDEQRRSIAEKFSELDKAFPQDGGLIQAAETHVVLLCKHLVSIVEAFRNGAEAVEQMIYAQLVAAIGKEVTPSDFAEYMLFHNRKLFHQQYEPQPFCYAIRRPDHFPEGTLAIESLVSDSYEPIRTIVRRVEPVHPMSFAIDASTRVTFNGQRYLHSWMGHSFQGDALSNLSLVARARQFSCFILIIGRISSATIFEPVNAIIVQNKDELRIPLNLEQIPAPRDFADAIQSLSPEQQAFCKAYRQMQLESTLFGLLCIQIKPQLEKLLNIPVDSLTKEIRLTQDLLDLFIRYQIPSDLVTYDGDEEANLHSKVDAVRTHVANMNTMIAQRRSSELANTLDTAIYRAIANEAPIGGGMHTLEGAVRGQLIAGRATRASGRAATSEGPFVDEEEDPSLFDFTAIPHLLDARMAKLDVDGALRPTIVTASPGNWSRTFQRSLMTDPETKSLSNQDKATEKNKAFDLLDALSRSGALDVDDCELHVVLTAMHRFDRSLLQTVVEDNINPIDKVERSTLIFAEVVHDAPVAELIKTDHLERVQTVSPILFQHLQQ